MIANPRSATVMGLLKRRARRAPEGSAAFLQQAGSVQTLFGRAKEWFLGISGRRRTCTTTTRLRSPSRRSGEDRNHENSASAQRTAKHLNTRQLQEETEKHHAHRNDRRVRPGTRIKVIGVGGGGGNAIEHMIAKGSRAEFVCANTDAQALNRSAASALIQLGSTGLWAPAPSRRPAARRPRRRSTASANPSPAPTCCSSPPAWAAAPAPARRR